MQQGGGLKGDAVKVKMIVGPGTPNGTLSTLVVLPPEVSPRLEGGGDGEWGRSHPALRSGCFNPLAGHCRRGHNSLSMSMLERTVHSM